MSDHISYVFLTHRYCFHDIGESGVFPYDINNYLFQTTNKIRTTMTETRERLNETFFHLKKMEDNIENIEMFRYHLHSFIAAARSVRSVMQREYGDETGFCDWYRKIQEQMRDDKEMEYMYKKRSFVLTGQPTRSGKKNAIPKDARPPGKEKINNLYYFEDYPKELPEKDVISLCRDHLDKLREIVDECENNFIKFP